MKTEKNKLLTEFIVYNHCNYSVEGIHFTNCSGNNLKVSVQILEDKKITISESQLERALDRVFKIEGRITEGRLKKELGFLDED